MSRMTFFVFACALVLALFGGVVVLAPHEGADGAPAAGIALTRLEASEVGTSTISTHTVPLSGRLVVDTDAVFVDGNARAAVPVVAASTALPGIGRVEIVTVADGSKSIVPLQGDIMPGVDPITWTVGGREVLLVPTTIGLEWIDPHDASYLGITSTWPSRLRTDVDLALTAWSTGGEGTALMPLLDALYVLDLASGVSATLPITGGLVPGVDIVFNSTGNYAVLPTVGHLHVIDLATPKIRSTIVLTGGSGRLRPDVDTRVVRWGAFQYALVPSMDGVYVVDIYNSPPIQRLISLPSDLVIGSDLATLNQIDSANYWAIMPTVGHLTLFNWYTGVSTTLKLPGRVRSNIDVLIEDQASIGSGATVFTATIPVAGAQNLLVRVRADVTDPNDPSLSIVEQLPLPGDIVPAVDVADVITGGRHYLVMPTNGYLSIFNTTDGLTTTIATGALRDDVDVLVNPYRTSDVILPTEGELVIVRDVPPARAVIPTWGRLYVVDIAGGTVETTVTLTRDLMLGVDAVGTDNMGFYGTFYFHVDEDIPSVSSYAPADHKVIDTTDHAALILLSDGYLGMVDELDGRVVDTIGPGDLGGYGAAGQITLDQLNKIAAVQLADHSLALVDLLQWHYYRSSFTHTLSFTDTLGGRHLLRTPLFAPRQGKMLVELEGRRLLMVDSFTGQLLYDWDLPAESRHMAVDSLNGYVVLALADGTLRFVNLYNAEGRPPLVRWAPDDGWWVWGNPYLDYLNGVVLVYIWDGSNVNLAVVDYKTASTIKIIPLGARPVGSIVWDYTNKIAVLLLDDGDVLVVDLFNPSITWYRVRSRLPGPLQGYRCYGYPQLPVIDYVNKLLLINMTDGDARYLFVLDLLTGDVIGVLGDNETHGSEPIWGADGYPERIYLAGDKKIALVTCPDGNVTVVDLWQLRRRWWVWRKQNPSLPSWGWALCCWYRYNWQYSGWEGWSVDVERGVVFDCLNDLAILELVQGDVYQVAVVDLLAPCWEECSCDGCFGPWGESFVQSPWMVGQGLSWWTSARSRLYLDYWDKRVDFFLEDKPWDVIVVPDSREVITAALSPPPLIVSDTVTPTLDVSLITATLAGGPGITGTQQMVCITGTAGAVDDPTAIVFVRNISDTVVPSALALAHGSSPAGFVLYTYASPGDTLCVSAVDPVGNMTDRDGWACISVPEIKVYLPLVLKGSQ